MVAITFQLCDVPRPIRPRGEVRLPIALRGLLGTPVEACGADVDRVVPVEKNAVLMAAWLAFTSHHPLVLSPDAVWLCIAQGFAAHVNLHAEQLRGRFVQHEGGKALFVRRDDFVKGSPDNPWPEVFRSFSEQIAGHIGRLRDLVVCDFSTTGPVERAASELVLMDAMQQYFEYTLVTLCGIPEITLTGTVEDWRSVRQRTQMLAEFELAWWTSTLLPVLDEFVAAASGRPDLAFWRHIFKHSSEDGSGGGTFVHGWILLLFPYFTDEPARPLRINPILACARGRSPVQPGGGAADWVYLSRIDPSGVPLGLSRAPLSWQTLDSAHAMDLVGGFVGVAQDPETLALRPAIGWAVRERAERVFAEEPIELPPQVHIEHRPPRPLTAEDFVDIDLEPVRCSRPATPEGRLILTFGGLRFVPTAGAERDPPSPDPRAVPETIEFTRTMLADLAVTFPDPDRVELTVPLPDGEVLRFVCFNDRLLAIHAWRSTLNVHPSYLGKS